MNAVIKAQTVYMSVFVIGELCAGFRGGSRPQENKNILKKFLSKPAVRLLNAGEETADIFGMIKHDLKNAGMPLPINDVWIAAHSIETGAVLVTYDAHFKKISGIRLWEHL